MKDNENTKISKQKKLNLIFQIMDSYDVSNYEIAQHTGISEAGLGSIKNGDTKNPREITVNAIYNYLINKYGNPPKVSISNEEFLSHIPEPQPTINPTVREVELTLKNILKNKAKKEYPNAKPNIKTDKLKLVKLIPEKVAMGLLSHFFDNEYVEQLETELIEVDEYFTEDAYKVDSVGESMNDGTARALLNGDKFLAKDIPRAKWGEKLINGGKNVFYILHNERGHLIKEITSHNIETKEINLHSWNPDKTLYDDFKVKTNECYIIASIEGLLYRKI